MNPGWMEQARCRDFSAELFFPLGSGPVPVNAPARQVCATCPVIAQCRCYAMALEGGSTASARFGVWAGLDPNERWLLSRRQRRAAS